MNLYIKYTAKPHSFLVIDTTLASDNPLRFSVNLLERIQELIMTTDDKIKDEKLQYDINRQAAKISALSSGKTDKYEYLAFEEMLPPGKTRMTEQAKFTYSPLGKALENQTKTTEYQERKQVKVLKVLKPTEQKLTIKYAIPKNKLNE